jgi:hypothetical protein
MKPSVILLITVAVLAFMGTVVWTTLGSAEVQCEVCLVFDGVETCRLGRGSTEDEALAAAKQSACGGNTSGMAEAIACQNRQPDRATCPAQ